MCGTGQAARLFHDDPGLGGGDLPLLQGSRGRCEWTIEQACGRDLVVHEAWGAVECGRDLVAHLVGHLDHSLGAHPPVEDEDLLRALIRPRESHECLVLRPCETGLRALQATEHVEHLVVLEVCQVRNQVRELTGPSVRTVGAAPIASADHVSTLRWGSDIQCCVPTV